MVARNPSGALNPVIAPAAPQASSSTSPTPPSPPKTGTVGAGHDLGDRGRGGRRLGLDGDDEGTAADHADEGGRRDVHPARRRVVLQDDRRPRCGGAPRRGAPTRASSTAVLTCTISARSSRSAPAPSGTVQGCLAPARPPPPSLRPDTPSTTRLPAAARATVAATRCCSASDSALASPKTPRPTTPSAPAARACSTCRVSEPWSSSPRGVEGRREDHPESGLQRSGGHQWPPVIGRRTCSTRCSAIARLDVAAGEGALRRAVTRPCRSIRKSSTRLPSRVHGLGPDPARGRAPTSATDSSGT